MGLEKVKVVKAERIGVFTNEREENERYRPVKIILQVPKWTTLLLNQVKIRTILTQKPPN